MMEREEQNTGLSRRGFLSLALGAGAAFAVTSTLRGTHPVAAAAAGGTVTIVNFDDAGKLTGKASVPRVVKTDAEWKKQLSPLVYAVTRQADTERPYTGATWNNHDHGVYRCACCDLALFRSETKFESGTGWPSFYQPIAKENVNEKSDMTLGMMRTEVLCRQCDAHLGHVFDDGPRPTGLRYCMNSASMKFTKTA